MIYSIFFEINSGLINNLYFIYFIIKLYNRDLLS